MNYPPSHYNLFPAPPRDERPARYARIKRCELKCSGKDCQNRGNSILKIKYINKSGYFCDKCTKDLLGEGLAIKAGNVSIE